MAKLKQNLEELNLDETKSDLKFSGVARSMQCFDNQGFRNFRIVTMEIKNGVVVSVAYSDPYASFEAISMMELWNEKSALNLNNNWKDGDTLKI